MQMDIRRSNETDLSDDQLIIFDVLFDSYCTVNSLKKGGGFSSRFNCASHAIDINELKDTLERLVTDGFMRFKLDVSGRNKQIVTYVGLTEKGGNLWEKERLPIWGKYVIDSSYHYKGFWELSIVSPTLEVAKDFIEIAQECKMYELMDPNDLTIAEIQGDETESLIPWKQFDKWYEITSHLSDKTESVNFHQVNWALYESKLMWWRDVKELQTLTNKISL